MIDSKNRNDYFAVWTSIVSEGAWCTPNEPITSTHAVLEWPDPPPPIDASLFDEDAADAAAMHEALEESDDRIPYEDLRNEFDL